MKSAQESIARPAGARQPLAGRRVAVTRAAEQAEELVRRLQSLGAEVIACPAISIAPPDDYTALDGAIAGLAEYDWVIFTSANGVEAFTGRLRALGRDLETLRSRKIAAIGPATAAALESAGCRPDFVPDAYVAEAIVEQIGDVRGCRVLLPRADIARKALAEGLRERGAHVDELAAYRTLRGEAVGELAAGLQAGEVDAVTFTSSSTVRYTIDNIVSAGISREDAVELLNRAAIVCIGPVTAGTARDFGLRVDAQAEEYTIGGLVDALVRLWSTP